MQYIFSEWDWIIIAMVIHTLFVWLVLTGKIDSTIYIYSFTISSTVQTFLQ